MKSSIFNTWSAVSLVTLVISSTSMAQTASGKDTAEANSPALEEIMVTATKRSENLVKVPMSITVFTDKDLAAAGIYRASDFLSSTPNVTFMEDNTGETFINIRGQTSSRSSDPNVAIVIDGVTLTGVRAFNQDLYDVKQIEVLKGPQSALYGRNAAAGAIVITTEPPSDEFEGRATFGRGNFNTSRATGYVSGPISDTLKFRVAGSYRTTDGPFTNSTTGEKVNRATTTLGRARLLYEPNDKLKVDLKLGGVQTTGGTLAYQTQFVGLPLGNFPGTELDSNNTDIPWVTNIWGVYDEKVWDATLKVDYDFGFANFTSISGINEVDAFFGGDLPPYLPDTGSPGALVASYSFNDRNYSQEFRLTSPSDQRFRWQVGFYYLQFNRGQYNELNVDTLGAVPATRGVIDPITSAQPTATFNKERYRTKSYAPFASFQFDVTSQLHLNLAGRYDTEKRKVAEVAPDQINPITGGNENLCIQLTGRAFADCHDARTFKQFEPKASISYDFSDNGSVYASYGKGFKSGGFNPIGTREAVIAAAESLGQPASSVYVQDKYDKEVSTSYEVGTKLRLFNQRLALNAAVFKTDIDGAQQFEFIPTVGLQTTSSIDKTTIKGFDFDFNAILPTGLILSGGYGYTDGEVKKFTGNPTFEGNVAPGSFKYTINLVATQTFDLTDYYKLTPRIEFNRYGKIWWNVANTPGTARKPLNLLDARLTLAGGDRWQIAAYGNNLTNEKYFQIVVPILSVFAVDYRGSTRTYGIEGTINF